LFNFMTEDSNKIAPIDFDADVMPKIVAALNKQKGYASFFDWPNKATKEKGIVCDLLEAMEAKGEQHGIVKVKSDQIDPPDCVGQTKDGELVGFEVTELVDQKTVEMNRRGVHVFKEWPPDELIAKLKVLVRDKDAKAYHGGPYSKIVLIIFTDEPLVRSADCESILHGQSVGHCKQISEAFLLLSYRPGLEAYPYVKLELGQADSILPAKS